MNFKILEELIYNIKLINVLKKLLEIIRFLNLLFYGLSGLGRYIRVRCFICEIYKNIELYNIKIEYKEYKI